jgi:hypothetical protein
MLDAAQAKDRLRPMSRGDADMTRLFRGLFAVACIAVAMPAAAPALAQTQRQLDWCFRSAGFSAALRIQGCTAAIQSGRQSGQSLLNAYYNRGIGRSIAAVASSGAAAMPSSTSSWPRRWLPLPA